MNSNPQEKERRSIKTFLNFLYSENLFIPNEKHDYEQDSSLKEKKFQTLFDCIQNYFHYFHENTLKRLITVALEYRNQQIEKQKTSTEIKDEDLLGEWAFIIDTMKLILQQRRDLAGSHFQQLVQYGMEGKPETVDFYLKELFHNGYIDHLFLGILNDTVEALGKNKNASNEENYFMLTYFQKTIFIMQKEQEEMNHHNLENQKKLEALQLKSSEEKKKAASNDPIHSTAANEFKEEELIYYSTLLNNLIKESNGNISLLQDKLILQMEKPTSNNNGFPYELFLFIIRENMKACELANYTNKLKLLQFLEKFLLNYLEKQKHSIQNVLEQNDFDKTKSTLSMYHAPQFIDHLNNPNASNQGMNRILLYPENIFNASHLIFNENIANYSTVPIPTNNKKKKQFRKNMKLKRLEFLTDVNEFLYTHGWVVIDNFIPLELVKRVRIESNLFRHFYDQAEIWVGKKADVGAHLTVPSVRGDRVLWVCGGHNVLNSDQGENDSGDEEDKNYLKKGYKPNHYAPEGGSRIIKTIGDIEPCKLEVKASAPIRKFTALKDAITSIDKLVEEFKLYKDNTYQNHLETIYERSDGMLSIYPGEGARFANHVDNTTKDGRKLTVVTYLNPNWTEGMGGSIRVRPKRHNYVPEVPTPADPASEQGDKTTSGDAKNEVKDSNATNKKRNYPNFAEFDGIDILPLAGRAIIFFSSQIEHEVMPTFGDRHALTIWYYDKHERKEAIERAKEEGITEKIAATSPETQTAAKDFIAELMGGDDIDEDGGNPTQEELDYLANKVKGLSDEILDIISSITGAPSVQSFREGFPMLTVTDLKSMRALFRRMGLQS